MNNYLTFSEGEVDLGYFVLNITTEENRICLIDDTATGKSMLADTIDTLRFDNVKVLRDIYITKDTIDGELINYKNDLTKYSIKYPLILIFDDCNLNKKDRAVLMKNIIDRNKKEVFFILIGRNINILGTPVYSLNKYNDKIKLEESSTLEDFKKKFNFDKNKTYSNLYISCEDRKSGLSFYKNTFNLGILRNKKEDTGGVMEAIVLANSVNKDVAVALAIDYVSDNPIVKKIIEYSNFTSNICLLSFSTFEELILRDIVKTNMYMGIDLSSKLNKINKRMLESVQKEINFKSNLHSKDKNLLKKYCGCVNTFEQLVYQIVHTLTGYQKTDTVYLSLENEDVYNMIEILNKIIVKNKTSSDYIKDNYSTLSWLFLNIEDKNN